MTTALHRLATWNDFDRVYEIYVDPAVIPYLGFEPMSRADFRPVYQNLLASGVFHVVELEAPSTASTRPCDRRGDRRTS